MESQVKNSSVDETNYATGRNGMSSHLAVREGPSYDPGIALEESDDHDKIPDPIWKPIIERINPSAECIIVAFDLKTTSLSTESSIAQIASTFQEKSFSVYILPSKPFTKEASNVTRLSMLEDKLYYGGTEVQAVGLEKGSNSSLLGFTVWQ